MMNNWGANHGAISYGHIGADLITLCSMLRIPVCMHNVPEKDIFRPAAWNAFGMDKEGQDYQCLRRLRPDAPRYSLNLDLTKKAGASTAFLRCRCGWKNRSFSGGLEQKVRR